MNRWFLRMGALTLVLSVASCGAVAKDDWFPVGGGAAQIANTPDLATKYISDTTRIVFNSRQHGTQIKYHDANGSSYLWYPGNRTIVPGKWQIRAQDGGGSRLCYRYGSNTFNPATGISGGEWECRRFGALDVSGGSAIKGDPFALASGSIPFVMVGKNYYAPEMVMEFLDKDSEELDYITNIDEID